jgi:capreomycidine synthase
VLLEPAPLEDWLRDYYFEASIDISSSGVEPYTFGEVQSLLGIDPQELAAVSFRDSRSAGAPELRSLIARRCGAEASQVIVTNGSSEAQFLVLAAILGAGDEVVVVEPAYHSLISIARALGCRVSRWRLRPEDRFRPDIDGLRRLVTSRTKMIVVNFPHNPTGVTLTPAEQLELVELAARHGCYLFWDGAFEDLVYDAPPLPAVSALYDRGLSFGTLSKSYGLPGLRVGWGIAPPAVVHGALSVRDYTTLALSPIVEFVAGRVLAEADRLLAPRLQLATRNRGLVHAWLDERRGLVACPADGAGVVVFPALAGVGATTELCHRLMRDHRVLLVPGECFQVPGHVRIGFGGNETDLRHGLTALSDVLAVMQRA